MILLRLLYTTTVWLLFCSSCALAFEKLIKQEHSMILEHIPFQDLRNIRLINWVLRHAVKRYVRSRTVPVKYTETLNLAFVQDDLEALEDILPLCNFYKLDFYIVDTLKYVDEEYAIPLNYAFLRCSSAFIRALIARGCVPNLNDTSCLHSCIGPASKDRLDKLNTLFDLGMPVACGSTDLLHSLTNCVVGTRMYCNLLCRAAEWDDILLLDVLDNNGLIEELVNLRDQNCMPPIFYCQSPQFAQRLIDAGASTSMASPFGLTAYQQFRVYEYVSGDPPPLKLGELLERNARPNETVAFMVFFISLIIVLLPAVIVNTM